MKKYNTVKIFLLSTLAVVSLASGSTVSKDIQTKGKALHEKACTKCHNSSVYTRADRKIKSLDSLEKRVRGCNSNTGANLFPEELKAVTKFLNSEYYKF